MKKTICALSLFVLLATAAAFGSWSQKLSVAIPFDFYVGQRAMPAGSYVIDGVDATGGVLTLRQQSKGHQVVINTTPSTRSASGKSELVFERVNGAYFLSSIWNAEADAGRKLPVSERQLEMAKAPGAKLTDRKSVW